jgi:hypothetical protein
VRTKGDCTWLPRLGPKPPGLYYFSEQQKIVVGRPILSRFPGWTLTEAPTSNSSSSGLNQTVR